MATFMKRSFSVGLLVSAALGVMSAQTSRRTLSLDDLERLKEVRDPQCSPDGGTVAFVVSTTDAKADKSQSHVWTVGANGDNERQMTFSGDSESSPRFSPDGTYLSFTSSRPGPPGTAKGSQVWLLDRRGGEAVQLTTLKGRLQSYEWAPDSKRLALVIGDPDPDSPDADVPAGAPGGSAAPGGNAADGGGRGKAPKPIVIDRYKFKQDVQGYLLSGRHSYIYLFDLGSKKLERLTSITATTAATTTTGVKADE
jgi:dipeptidyl aminopeptidase/acylaminoacyl peptidase